MRYTISLVVTILFIACTSPAEKEEDKKAVIPVTVIPFSPLQTAIHNALTNIMAKEIESTGNTITTIQISGMEIRRISKKEYFITEKEQQEIQFKNYLLYLSRFSKTNSPLNNPAQLQQSMAKHNAVMAYLEQAIKRSSSSVEIYKVVYYLNAAAGDLKYNQLKTTFLDTGYKKIVTDYSFLNHGF